MKKLFSVLIMLVLTGCATAYQPQGATGGYTDRQLNERMWIIAANGNGFTNAQRVQDIVLLRAAEIGREKGFSHFLIVGGDSTRDVSSYTTPQTTNAYANCYGGSCYGNSYTSGGQSFPIVKHGSKMQVIYLEEGVDEIPINAVSVEMTWNQLAPRYLN